MNADESKLQEGCPRVPRARLGKADMRGSGVTELRLIAGVNEAVKVAIEASEKIGLLAINANLMAGRAGAGALGFCVVAGELRGFSDGMAVTMQNWSKLIFELVRETARSRNHARLLCKLGTAARGSDASRAALCATHAKCLEELNLLTRDNSLRVIALREMIRRAERQSITGEVISRSAMIESVYGGIMRPVLQQIAVEIDSSITMFTSFSNKVGFMMNKENE